MPVLRAIVLTVLVAACTIGSRPGVYGDEPQDDVQLASIVGNNTGWETSWVVSAGGSHWDNGTSCVILEDGSSIFGGTLFMDSQVTIAPESDEPIVIGEPYISEAMLLVRLDQNGNPDWARIVGGVNPSVVGTRVQVALSTDGGLHVAGTIGSGNPVVFGSGEPTETEIPALPSLGVFLARYELDGDFSWVTIVGGEVALTSGEVVAALKGGAVLLGGYFHHGDSVVFGRGTAGETTVTTLGEKDGFIARYGSDGRFQWVIPGCAGPDDDSVEALAVHGESFVAMGEYTGHVTCTGTDGAEIELSSDGEASEYLARYDADGRLLWARDVGILNGSRLALLPGLHVAFLENGDIAAAGSYDGTLPVGLGGDFEPVDSVSPGQDVFLSRFAPEGTPLWTTTVASYPGEDPPVARGLSELDDGRIALAGFFWNRAVFGNAGLEQVTIEDYDDRSGFLALYESTGHLAWVAPQRNGAVLGLADDAGTILVAGSFTDTACFGTGGLDSTCLHSAGKEDAYFMRLERVFDPEIPK